MICNGRGRGLADDECPYCGYRLLPLSDQIPADVARHRIAEARTLLASRSNRNPVEDHR